MPERDSQTIVLSRQSILLVTAVSVGLLTLCYVLGVQVGKQSAALRNPAARGSGEELQELPASIEEQLKTLQATEMVPAEKAPPREEAPKAPAAEKPEAAAKPEASPAAEAPKPVKEEAKPAREEPKPTEEDAKKAEVRWTLQLVSTPDAEEAERLSAKAKAAGYRTVTVKDKRMFKVRLAKPGPRAEVDAAAAKLRDKGFKPFAVKVE